MARRTETVYDLRVLAERRRAMGIKKRRARPERLKVLYPSSIEREYRRRLAAYVQALQHITASELLPKLPRILEEFRQATESGRRQDAWYDDLDEILKALGISISRQWTEAELATIAQRVGRDVNSFVSQGLELGLERVLGVNILSRQPWLRDVLEGFSVRNVGLIRSVSSRYFDEIRNLTFQGVSEGLRAEEISRQIQERLGVAESRADTIARDQVGKLLGQTNKLQQTGLGVRKYIWSTSLDERVRGRPDGLYPNARPSHWHREGKVFSWDEPPEGGHPGEDIKCRCSAIPVLDDLLENPEG